MLKGETQVLLRESVSLPSERRSRTSRSGTTPSAVAAALTAEGLARYVALKAWRAEVARAHNLPAYVIFHDATLAAIAAMAPQTLADLRDISGIGASKLEKYGEEVLRVVLSY